MPTIQMQNPLAVASDAVGEFYRSKRAQELQQRAEAHQRERDQRADFETDRTYTLAQQRAADEHETTQSNLATAAQSRAIAQANEDYEKQMRPLREEYQRIQNKLANGQLADQGDLRKLRQYEITEARVRAAVAQRYGIPLAALQVQQGQASAEATRAGIASTNASTDATRERTSEERGLYPLRVQEAQQGVRSGALDYDIKKRTFDTLGPPVDPKLQQDYRARLSTWKTQYDQWQRMVASGKFAPTMVPVLDENGQPKKDANGQPALAPKVDTNGKPVPPPAPVEPMSPEDFEATVADTIEALKRDPSKRVHEEQSIDASPQLSPYQKRMAHLRISAALGRTLTAAQSAPQSVPYGMEFNGGSQGAGPFPAPSPGSSSGFNFRPGS